MVLAWKFPFNDSSPELLYKCTKIATSQFIFICNSAETNEHDFGALWLPFSKIKCENKHFNYMLSSNGIKRWPFTHTQKWDTLTISPANSWRRYALVFSQSLRTIQSLYTFSIEMLFLFHVWIVTHFSSANIPTWFGISGAFVSVCFFFNSDECAWFDSSHRFVGARKPRIPIPNVTWSLNTSTSAHNFNWKLILPWERKRKLFLRTNTTTKTRVNAIHWKLSRLWLHSNWVQCERECVSEWKNECDWTFFFSLLE